MLSLCLQHVLDQLLTQTAQLHMVTTATTHGDRPLQLCAAARVSTCRYKSKGFTVVGFPCNQFGAQEPGDNSTIKRFAQSNYGVTVSSGGHKVLYPTGHQ
jgi:glutathione peroxidase-family protein